MPIKVLQAQLISKIAAGEVVERPASVVKELVENSLDADATQVNVEIQGGGTSLIRVSDNGSGIPHNEVELAFQHHATSKMDRLADLESITTLGFRGEALPSIKSVADIDILTNTDDEVIGTYLQYNNSTMTLKEKRSRPRGTTITVRQLFRNFPARLKFLKSPSTENGHIANLMTQYAMAYPEVRFSLNINNRTTLQTTGNGNLRDVIAEVYGLEAATTLLNVEKFNDLPIITGLTSPPTLSRSTRDYLSFFINRRWVRSSLLSRAALDAYQSLLMNGKHPIVILSIALPPQEIDVNVHPSKTEVKFRYSQAIYTAVVRAIESALAIAPLPKFKTPTAEVGTSSLWTAVGFDISSLPILRVVGQLSSSYIVAEGPTGLYLVDQHAAHERILFEKILEQRYDKKMDIQGLLEPLTIELSPKQEEVFTEKGDLITEFGFSIEYFGGHSYIIRALPAILKNSNPSEVVKDLLDSLEFEKDLAKREETIAQSLACHSAIRAGKSLNNEEMREMIRQLEETKKPRTCPHGRPTMIHISSHQLEREFGRTG